MRTATLVALSAALAFGVLPATAADVGDALAGVPATAETPVAFSPGIPLLTRESQTNLIDILPKANPPACYWVAQGRTRAQAEALRAGIGEFDIPVERVVPLVREDRPAEARIYCAPPPRVVIDFEPGAPTLMPEAEATLPLVYASYGASAQMLSIRGFASARETADVPMLSINRANAARDFLIAAGLPAERMTIEGVTEDPASAVPRVEITAAP
jgi:outer membrane protein OmpA-like peptidoglycan-associated protein